MALQRIQEIFQGIVQDPEINSGRPIIKDTRVFADLIIGHLEQGMSIKEICQEYDLTEAQVRAVKNLKQEQIQYIKGYADAVEKRTSDIRRTWHPQGPRIPPTHPRATTCR